MIKYIERLLKIGNGYMTLIRIGNGGGGKIMLGGMIYIVINV